MTSATAAHQTRGARPDHHRATDGDARSADGTHPQRTGSGARLAIGAHPPAVGGYPTAAAVDPDATLNPPEVVRHLTPRRWAQANRLLVRKALAEFSHERLLTPEPLGGDRYRVRSDDGTVEYRFRARMLSLEHWHIPPESITRHAGDTERPLDAVDFILEFRRSLGLTDPVLPVYLEEINSTLAGMAYKLDRPQLSAAELARADFQAIEAGMTEGHPCFIANNGRLGFGGHEYHRYAPETGQPVRLIWLAAHRDHAVFTCAPDLDYDSFIRSELGDATLRHFADLLAAQGLDLADYLLIPVHPWQWWNKLSVSFASEVAQRRLVCLGAGPDEYQPQQSVRTFFNLTHPEKHYVKTALSVLNMGFMRGLSAAYMAGTPAINDWLVGLIRQDPVLQQTGVDVIAERAAIGYRHRQFEAATERSSPYRKMLAALWRESPVPKLAPGQRLATMASLLHRDADGGSFAAALIAESGLSAPRWLRRYLDAYLVPLLHCFYAYDLAFMPHGENVILVLENGVVRRVFLKDIAEEIVLMDPEAKLPEAVRRIQIRVPEDEKLLSIFTDVFDCFFRHLNAVLVDAGVLDEETFWRTVADAANHYMAANPQLKARFERYDLFADEFALSCLNRLQLRNNQQMVDLSDPSSSLQMVGTLRNPIAGMRQVSRPPADGTTGRT